MTNDIQRLKAYREFGQTLDIAIDDLNARLSVLAEERTILTPEPGTRVENLADDPKLRGLVCTGIELDTLDEGFVWVAWEDGQVMTEYVADLVVLS